MQDLQSPVMSLIKAIAVMHLCEGEGEVVGLWSCTSAY